MAVETIWTELIHQIDQIVQCCQKKKGFNVFDGGDLIIN